MNRTVLPARHRGREPRRQQTILAPGLVVEGMAERWRPQGFAACARCGSADVEPNLLVMGPIFGISSDSRTYRCHACGYRALPVFFETVEERRAFEREKQRPTSPPVETSPTPSIPILPLDAKPVVDVPGLDRLTKARVVGVRWFDGRIKATKYSVPFTEYWEAVGGPRYNASRVFVFDLAAIHRADPQFDTLRKVTRRCTIWLDIGARKVEDVMDGYMTDAERVVVSTMALSSAQSFADIYALAPGIVPCIGVARDVVWSRPGVDTDLPRLAAFLRSVGFEDACVLDLNRLGTESGPDPALVERLASLDLSIHLGGGVQEADLPKLVEGGLAGGLIDPYTPVIRDLLLPRREGPTPADAPPAPQPKPDTRGAPAPG